jgi:hypothetical protein
MDFGLQAVTQSRSQRPFQSLIESQPRWHFTVIMD